MLAGKGGARLATDNRTSTHGPLTIQGVREGDRYVLKLRGELDLSASGGLEEELRWAEATDATSVMVDLRSLRFMDSTGLSVLLKTAARLAGNEHRLVLIRGPAQVQRVFKLTDTESRFEFVD